MPGNLHVRNLDDNLIAKLKRRAARHGRSTEAEHREILRQALTNEVEPSFETLATDLRRLTRDRKHTPSEILLREGRKRRRAPERESGQLGHPRRREWRGVQAERDARRGVPARATPSQRRSSTRTRAGSIPSVLGPLRA